MKKARIIDCEGKFIQITVPYLGVRKGVIFDLEISGNKYYSRMADLISNETHWLDGTLKTTCEVLDEKDYDINLKKIHQRLLKFLPISGCSLGSDPEVFLVDSKNVIIPAFNFLPKKSESTTAFWDGFQAEFLTSPGKIGDEYCLAFLTDSVHDGLSEVLEEAKNYNSSAKLTWKSVVEIPKDIMKKAKPEHVQLGCAPSLNIYGITPIRVGEPTNLPIRFAGCHFHFGIDDRKNKEEKAKKMVELMDAIFGVISVSLLDGMEDHRRRRYYGRAGEYRLPPWGVEYRTPSSAVLAHPMLFHLSFELARFGYFLSKFPRPERIWEYNPEEVKDIINSYDVSEAKKIIRANESSLKILLSRKFGKSKSILNLIYNGALSQFKLDDMERDWKLGERYEWISHSAEENCSVTTTKLRGDRGMQYQQMYEAG